MCVKPSAEVMAARHEAAMEARKIEEAAMLAHLRRIKPRYESNERSFAPLVERELAQRGLDLLKTRRAGMKFDARNTIILNWIECILEARINPVEIPIPVLLEGDHVSTNQEIFNAITDYVQIVKPQDKPYAYRPKWTELSIYELGLSMYEWDKADWFMAIYMTVMVIAIAYVAITTIGIPFCIFCVLVVLTVVLSGTPYVILARLGFLPDRKVDDDLRVIKPFEPDSGDPNKIMFRNIWDVGFIMEPGWSSLFFRRTRKGIRKFPRLSMDEEASDVFDLVRFQFKEEQRTFKDAWKELEQNSEWTYHEPFFYD
jgi:hypothetical protein